MRWIPSLVLLVATTGCEYRDQESSDLGAPLPGLTTEQLARFREGEELFNHVFTPAEGVGPLFNENQCSACHTVPATGGTGEQFLVKGTRFTPPDRCDGLSGVGGDNVRTQVTPLLEAAGVSRQPFPPEATERGRFAVPFLFGLGLVEAIPAEEILKHADPNDANRDGISGRAGRDAHGQLARFGRKAELASLRDFIDTAARFEMGLTTPAHAFEGTLVGRPFPPGVDPAAEPELSDHSLDRLLDFVRFLAPAPRIRLETRQEQADVVRGEEFFHRAGCTGCHVPSMTTARNDIAALDRKTIHLYSDLLLHDLGPQLANVCGVAATPSELRTAPLMGLGRRTLFLHDSRARDLWEAIRLHAGEATAARERFQGMNRLDQEKLLQFLRTL